MAIINTLTTTQVADALLQDDYASWSYAGAQALAEYLEEYSEAIGEDVELDVIGIRCEYSEYKTLEDLKNAYPTYAGGCDDDEDFIHFLEGNTTLIEVAEGHYIVADLFI